MEDLDVLEPRVSPLGDEIDELDAEDEDMKDGSDGEVEEVRNGDSRSAAEAVTAEAEVGYKEEGAEQKLRSLRQKKQKSQF